MSEGVEYALHLRVRRAARARELDPTGDGDGGALITSATGTTVVVAREHLVAP